MIEIALLAGLAVVLALFSWWFTKKLMKVAYAEGLRAGANAALLALCESKTLYVKAGMDNYKLTAELEETVLPIKETRLH